MSHTYKTYAPLTRAAILRAQNDVFRVECRDSSVRLHPSVEKAFGPMAYFQMLGSVALYLSFTDDPEDTHDHGMFEIEGVEVFWRIVYESFWDKLDPTDVVTTRRFLRFKVGEDPIHAW